MDVKKVLKMLGRDAYAFGGWIIAIIAVRKMTKNEQEKIDWLDEHTAQIEKINAYYENFRKKHGID